MGGVVPNDDDEECAGRGFDLLNDLKRIEEKIDGKFEEFQKFLNTLSRKMGQFEAHIENCKEDKDEIKNTLYGNGKDGLVLIVDRIRTRLKIVNIMKQGLWTKISIIVMCIGVIGSLVFGIAAYHNTKTLDSQVVKKGEEK